MNRCNEENGFLHFQENPAVSMCLCLIVVAYLGQGQPRESAPSEGHFFFMISLGGG